MNLTTARGSHTFVSRDGTGCEIINKCRQLPDRCGRESDNILCRQSSQCRLQVEGQSHKNTGNVMYPVHEVVHKRPTTVVIHLTPYLWERNIGTIVFYKTYAIVRTSNRRAIGVGVF